MLRELDRCVQGTPEFSLAFQPFRLSSQEVRLVSVEANSGCHVHRLVKRDGVRAFDQFRHVQIFEEGDGGQAFFVVQQIAL